MKSAPEDTEARLSLVQEDYILATACAAAAASFGSAMMRGDLPMDSWLYRTVFVSQVRELVMALARMLDRDKNTASLVNLLNHVEQNPMNCVLVTDPESDPKLSERECRDEAIRLRDQVHAIGDAYPLVKQLRDGMLSHTDRRYRLGSREFVFGDDELKTMQACLQDLGPIVNAVSRLIKNAQMIMLNTEHEIKREFGQLLEDRAPRNRMIQAARERLLKRSTE